MQKQKQQKEILQMMMNPMTRLYSKRYHERKKEKDQCTSNHGKSFTARKIGKCKGSTQRVPLYRQAGHLLEVQKESSDLLRRLIRILPFLDRKWPPPPTCSNWCYTWPRLTSLQAHYFVHD
mmetsp:Transcript_30033/g.72117  ORF Transcript_30033/g.72117 Transcript_30033/m.72117 type:complete len:121 (-) Transcript_30033:90-452(-)